MFTFLSHRFLWASLCLVLLLMLACSGAGGTECIGSVVYNGQTYQPESGVSDADTAQRLACNQYCLEADPEYEAMHAIWADSPRGEPGVSKEEAIYKDDDLMNFVTHTCANRCVADVAAGRLEGSVTCQ